MNVSPLDIAEHIKKVLSAPLSGWIKKYFIRTRNYELGIYFVGTCRMLIGICSSSFSHSEYIDFDVTLTYMYLDMLDYANQWYKYVQEFDFCRKNKQYALAYQKGRKKGIGYESNEADNFFSYVMEETPYAYKVHFLYVCSHRYSIIKRKIARYESGSPVGNLMRHSQDLLSDDEFEQRLWDLKRELMEYINKMKEE